MDQREWPAYVPSDKQVPMLQDIFPIDKAMIEAAAERQRNIQELVRLAKMAAENFDDALEERPMRHSIGSLRARMLTTIAAMEGNA